MKRMIGLVALGLAVCLLVQAAASGDGSGHERPYVFKADSCTFRLNIDPSSPDYGQAEEWQTGVATLRGRVTNHGGGYVDMETGVYSGSGVATDASGDETWWWIEDVIGPTMVVHIDGGTGRFEGAVGELNAFEFINVVEEVQWPYLITTCELRGTGWLIY
jgi:hypothetical protein